MNWRKRFAGRYNRKMESPWTDPLVIRQTEIIERSFKRWTGRNLFPEDLPAPELARKVFQAPFVLVSHGTEADPVLNYGNGTALALWGMTWEELTRTPSRLTAEAPNREERARLLETVACHGFIDDYSGVRISKSGKRFQIRRATVWNLLSSDREFSGQAAMFHEWEFI